MRSSPNSLLLRILATVVVVVILALAYRFGYAVLIAYLLYGNPPSGMPNFSSTQVNGFSFATARPPGHIGEGLIAGDIALYVNGVTRPANSRVGSSADFRSLQAGEEYLWVDVYVTCRSASESCHVTENDFGVRSANGSDYSAEFGSMFSGLSGLFDGGEIAPGQSASGALVFVIHTSDTDLRLFYPRMFGFTNTAEFILTP